MPMRWRRAGSWVMSVPSKGSVRRRIAEPGDGLDQGGLAVALHAGDADDLAAADVKG
jgi:hypothetical protein